MNRKIPRSRNRAASDAATFGDIGTVTDNDYTFTASTADE
jgi:hypothetical protein